MNTPIAEINALCADIQAKLSALSEQDQLRVAYKSGLVQSEFNSTGDIGQTLIGILPIK